MLQLVSTNPASTSETFSNSGTALDQAASLLNRYPNLQTHELARLIDLYRGMSALDIAKLLSDTETAPVLGRFHAEQREKIRAPFREYAVLVFMGIAGIATIAWATIAYQ